MSKQLEKHEAEAVLALRGSNEKAWNTLMSYFNRRYDFESGQCVDVRLDHIQITQGKARILKELKEIEQAAEDTLEAIKK